MNTKVYRYIGFIFLFTEIAKQLCLTFYLNDASYIWWHFPFQLCSIPMYLCLIIGFCKNEKLNKTCVVFLMDYGLLAGFCAFFDTTGMHYGFAPLTIHSYLWHIGMIILGIYSGITITQLPISFNFSKNTFKSSVFLTFADFPRCTGIFILCSLLATGFNIAFHPFGVINMFYISPYYKMTQVFFDGFARLLGDEIAKIIYVFSIIKGAGYIHSAWMILQKIGLNAIKHIH